MKAYSVSAAIRFTGLLLCLGATALVCPLTAQINSLNILGYVDVDLVAGSNLVANPLKAADNRISSLFRGVPDGTVFLPWRGGSEVDFGPTNLYSASNGWTFPAAALIAPDGGFLCLPAATRITFMGDAAWPVLTNHFGGVRWTVQDRFPQRWPPVFCTSFAGPCPEANLVEGTQFHKWNRAQQRYTVYTYTTFDGLFPSGWYDENMNAVNPQLEPGEAGLFWVPDFSMPITWMRSGECGADVTIREPQRAGTNLMFRFTGMGNQPYAVLRCTNLSQKSWQVVQTGTSTSTLYSISVDASQQTGGFYRVIPAGEDPVLVNPSRNGNSFSFEFFALTSTSYVVLKKTDLAASTWTTVNTIVAPANSVVRVNDPSASSTRGYYIVQALPPRTP